MMGRVLRPEHISYFTDRMDDHDKVDNWEIIDDQDDYLFRIKRTVSSSKSDVVVHLTDAYRYGLAEFFARPDQLLAGSFVVLGLPHGDFDDAVVEEAKKKRIGIGHIGKFMGAINYRNIWEYMTPEERNRKEQAQLQERKSGNR